MEKPIQTVIFLYFCTANEIFRSIFEKSIIKNMSDIINILPDSIANQIAAGEVIQRPASVVKELVENSVDAGADKISVVVKGAGRTLVQVADNGKGMSHTDARMSFERHATSKISKAGDLFGLRTMGFRGEALASIAAVAAVEMRTRQAGADFGTVVEIAASNIIRHEPDSCVEGTVFAVKNLFFNVPARRKFLKSDETELRHIIYEFQRVALANPHIELSLYNGTEALYELPAGNFKQRITAIFGKKSKNYASQLIDIAAETNLVKISGFVGSPQSASRNATQFFFVNGRFMRHPYFGKAIQMAYDNMLPHDTQPIYFITLEVKPENIDVNVHPTKTEIKFEDEKEIFAIIMSCVRESLGKFNFLPSLDFDTNRTLDIPAYLADNKPDMPQINTDSNYNPFAAAHSTSSNRGISVKNWDMLYERRQQQASPYDTAEQKAFFSPDEVAKSNFWIYRDKYLITAVKSGLMIIDRQLALERITYEQILLRLQQGQKATQALLFAETITFSADENITFETILPELEAIGFDIDKLSAPSYTIAGIPSFLTEVGSVPDLLRDIVGYVVDNTTVGKEIYEKIAIRTAKAYARKTHSNLNAQETEALIASLFQCRTPNYSPEGIKTVVILSDADIWG